MDLVYIGDKTALNVLNDLSCNRRFFLVSLFDFLKGPSVTQLSFWKAVRCLLRR